MACRTSANVKMGEMAFAGLLQTSKWGKWHFAELLQTSKWEKRHLQESCKRHGNTVGICRNPASATEIRLAFAGMLQVPRKYGWHLQECCKRQNGGNSLRSILYDSKEKRRMNALEINAELQHELSVIADDEGYLKRALKSIRRLADQKRKEDETYMTDEEFQAKINRSLEQARRGEVIELLPGESLDDMLRRAGYDDK